MAVRDHSDRERPVPVFDVGIRRLAIVVGLPLVDGVYLTLVLAGILDSLVGIALTGIVIFGGTATAAVVLAECRGKLHARLVAVGLLGLVIIPVAGVQAMLAPTIATWLDVALLERFAAIVLTLIAIDMLGLSFREYLPRPGPVVVLALLVSLDPSSGILIAVEPSLLIHGSLAAAIGITSVGGWLLVGDRVRPFLVAERVRFAGGLALATLAVTVVTPVPMIAAVGALISGLVYSLDLDRFVGRPIDVSAG